MSNTTLAQIVGAMFGDDGQVFETPSGRKLSEVCEQRGAKVERPNGRGVDPVVYVFVDGSAIVETTDAWDFRAEGCTAHCWDGIGCNCHNKAAQASRDAVDQEADDLINRSAKHDQIVTAKWADDLEGELLIRCDDWVENGDVLEFWGEDGNGDWRVHLVKPERCDD